MTKDQIMRELAEQYQSLRQLNLARQRERINEIATKHPAIAAVDQEKAQAISNAARAQFEGSDADDAKAGLEAELSRLTAKQAAMLEEEGYPKDYLELEVRCPTCRDAGYIGEGQRQRCSCLQNQYLQMLYQQSDLPELSRQNFEAFDLAVFPEERQKAQMDKARGICHQYAAELPGPNRPNLIICGEAGLGKTYLLNCIAKEAIDRGLGTVKLTAYRLVDMMFDRAQDKNIIEGLYQCDLLLIDDLGAEPMLNNVTIESLYQILNDRLVHKRAMVIATNLTPTGLMAQYGERISSRLMDTDASVLIKLSGKDIRLTRR